jgi:hypothetical protein
VSDTAAAPTPEAVWATYRELDRNVDELLDVERANPSDASAKAAARAAYDKYVKFKVANADALRTPPPAPTVTPAPPIAVPPAAAPHWSSRSALAEECERFGVDPDAIAAVVDVAKVDARTAEGRLELGRQLRAGYIARPDLYRQAPAFSPREAHDALMKLVRDGRTDDARAFAAQHSAALGVAKQQLAREDEAKRAEAARREHERFKAGEEATAIQQRIGPLERTILAAEHAAIDARAAAEQWAARTAAPGSTSFESHERAAADRAAEFERRAREARVQLAETRKQLDDATRRAQRTNA